jgi:hypothetical protein
MKTFEITLRITIDSVSEKGAISDVTYILNTCYLKHKIGMINEVIKPQTEQRRVHDEGRM